VGLAVIRQAEKRTIWVGMRGNGPIQMGPRASLMGWSEMRDPTCRRARREVRLSAAELAETVSEIERGSRAPAQRGVALQQRRSEPNLHCGPIRPTSCAWWRTTWAGAPRGAAGRAARALPAGAPVRHNSELLAWAIENLITNGAVASTSTVVVQGVGRPSPDGRWWRSP